MPVKKIKVPSITVRAKEALLLIDDNGFTLDISKTAFANEPKKTYEVPDSPFWRKNSTETWAKLEFLGAGKAKVTTEKDVPDEPELDEEVVNE